MLTSSQNPKIKLVRSLANRTKERRAAGAFVAEGVRLAEEAASGGWKIQFVLFDETLSERGRDQVERFKAQGVECGQITPAVMKSISDTETSQGILAVLDLSSLPIPNSPSFLLIPDQVRDPGNLGALLRSANACGVDAVLIPPETTDPFAPKVLRAGMGAHFHLPIFSMSWDEIKNFVGSAGLRLILADMDGISCWETDLRPPLALVIGGEAEGASEEAQNLAAVKIKIPMTGKAESLNAAVAGSVLMFEAMRQKNQSHLY